MTREDYSNIKKGDEIVLRNGEVVSVDNVDVDNERIIYNRFGYNHYVAYEDCETIESYNRKLEIRKRNLIPNDHVIKLIIKATRMYDKGDVEVRGDDMLSYIENYLLENIEL